MADGEGQGFVHLRVRSAYSLLEGAIKAGKLGKLAADAGMPAVAIAATLGIVLGLLLRGRSKTIYLRDPR